ncbi:MAG: PQQ-like beta-propeller repeat protein [Planctomycetota bacterium]|nr:PQQ-like beta-propeller repeat protein [Planctomycetota bacterium]
MKRYGAVIRVVVILATTALGAAGADAGKDWPQWRGPKRDGISTETGLLKEWPTGGPPLVWTAKGLGAGYSGPSIAGGKVYTMGDVGGSSSVLCLDAATGKQVWIAKVGKTGGGGGHPGPRCTPTVDGGLVFALDQFGELVCLQAATGQPVWSKNLTTDFKGGVPGWGYAESPLVDGPLVIVTPGGRGGALAALNKTTGAVVWRSTGFNDGAHYSSAIVAEIGGVRQYIQLTGENVAGVAATTGQVLWRAPRKGQVAVVATPIYADNEVFVTSSYDVGHNAFKISGSGGQFSAARLYDGKEITNHHGGVVLVGQCLYGHSDSGGWTCMDFKTGKVVWKNGGVGKGSVVCADGRLYTRSEGGKGTIALVEASPDGYKEHGRFNQPDLSGKNTWPHPVVCGGKLYIRDQDGLLCYDVKAK